ncbi:MAG: hypothetical protein M1819_001388 [Sarea resinae]|nr:MAG: hypothetical protein M1819_001388 [Sarea resinae]
MDGLLIDSEDLYTICTNTLLREYGRPDLPWSIKAQLQGRPGPEAGRIFQEWAQLPITREEFMIKQTALQKELFPRTQPLPGVLTLLQALSAATTTTNKPVHIALATSSHKGNFDLKTTHLSHVFSLFPTNRRILGDDPRIPLGKGKPAPDIFLLALKLVNDSLAPGEPEVRPEECLVFEDSVPGVEAGRRAGMRVVWCPHPGLLEEYSGREKQVLAGLAGQEQKKELEGTKEVVATKDDIQGKEERSGERVKGAPGRIDDGWAILLKSLEDFPYEEYGILVGVNSDRL